MKRYCASALALLFLTLGCQSSKDGSSRTINDFTLRWVTLVQQNQKSQLQACLSSSASPEAMALTQYVQQAKNQRIDIRFELSKTITEKPAPREYQVALPFVLSGPVGSHQKGTVTLWVQEDVFGAFNVADMSDDLRLGLGTVRGEGDQSSSDTKNIVSSRDSIRSKAAAVRALLTHPNDQIIYYTYVDTTLLFYVARGDWDYSALYDDRTKSNYQLGVVDAQGNEVIPVSFDKIYNPGGTLPSLIEVERNGKRGFYNLQGQPVVSVSFDAVYPYSEDKEVLAQVRFDGRYGWLDARGNLHLNPDSHADPSLFASPASSNRLLQWKYNVHHPGLSYLRLPNQYNEHGLYGAIFVVPSYLHDLGLVDEYHINLLIERDDWDDGGVEGGHVSIIELTSLTQQIRGLVAKFVEWGADARGYHYERDKLVTLNEDLTAVATLTFSGDYQYHLPHPELPFRDALFETRELKTSAYLPYDEMTQYSYYQIGADGEITTLETSRIFPFTKFMRVSEEHFRGTFRNYIEMTASSRRDQVNLVTSYHLTQEDLDVMRNEIFAEYGYRFQSEKWKAYFARQPWYTPRYDNVDPMLTDIDRYNIRFIHHFQQKMQDHEADYIQRDSTLYLAAG